jgi:hypothetical protein
MSGLIFMAAAKSSLFLMAPVKSVFVYCWIHSAKSEFVYCWIHFHGGRKIEFVLTVTAKSEVVYCLVCFVFDGDREIKFIYYQRNGEQNVT